MTSPKLKIEYLPVSGLVPYARNARTHSPAQVSAIAASIREFGFTNPVLVDPDGGIVAGHGRVLAAIELGMVHVPCLRLGWLTEAQKRAYVLADNRLALDAGWDDRLLGEELRDLLAGGFDLGLLGFDPAEAAELIAGLGANAGQTDPDDAPPVAEAVSRLGDAWVLGRHRIVCGDCTEQASVDLALAGVKPNLMVTDPPYGVEYDPKWRAKAGVNKSDGKMGDVLNDDRADWREAWAMFSGDVAYVWHAGRHATRVQNSLEVCGFDIRCQIVWAKDRFALSRGHYHWQHEPCWYAVRSSANGNWHGDRSQSTLWRINAREDGGLSHGTQKPVECMKRPIENNSSAGQAVYEPFSGSGTTIIAAEMTGRSCHAIELSPQYVDVAVRRWQNFTGEGAILESSGQSFAEVEAARAAGAAPK